jgi:hypothetical protein
MSHSAHPENHLGLFLIKTNNGIEASCIATENRIRDETETS